jgi:hypothetical protein
MELIMLRLKREAVTGSRRKLRNEELPSLCHSPDIISVIKSRGIR